MSDTRTAVLKLEIKYAQAEARQALRSIDRLKSDSEALDDVQRDLARAAKALTRETAGAAQANTRFGREVADSTKALRAQEQAAARAQREVDRLARSQEAFDATSRDVGLAGDVQSNLGAVSGLAGVAGLDGASGGIAAAGEFAALIEELPRLSQALKGLPATVSAAGNALGAGKGLAGLIGAGGAVSLAGAALIAAPAVIGVVAAFRKFNKQIEIAKLGLNNAIDALLETNRVRFDSDATVEETTERIRDLNEEQNALISTLSGLTNAYEGLGPFQRTEKAALRERIETLGAELDASQKLEAGLQSLIDTNALASQEIQRANEQARQLAEEEAQLTAERQRAAQAIADNLIEQRRQLIESTSDEGFDNSALADRQQALERERASIEAVIQQTGISEDAQRRYLQRLTEIDQALDFLSTTGAELAQANTDAANAEQLRTQQVQQALAGIERQVALERQANELRNLTTQQLDERVIALQQERDSLAATIPALQALAATSDEAASRLAAAQQRLTNIDAEVGQAQAARPAAARREAAESARQAAEAERNLAQSRQESIAAARQQRDSEITRARTQLNDKLVDLEKDFGRKRADLARKQREALQEVLNERGQIEADYQARLREINRTAEASQLQAVQSRNVVAFLAAEQEKRQQQQAAAEERQQREQEIEARLAQLRQQQVAERAELAVNYERQREDARVAYQRQLRDIQAKFAQETQAAQQAYRQQLQQLQTKLRQETQLQRQAQQAQLTATQRFSQTIQQGAARLAQSAQGLLGRLANAAKQALSGARGGGRPAPRRPTPRPARGGGSSSSGRGNPLGRLIGGVRGAIGFNTGGIAANTGLAVVDRKERVLTPRQTEAFERLVGSITSGGGQTITVNVDARGAIGVEQVVAMAREGAERGVARALEGA